MIGGAAYYTATCKSWKNDVGHDLNACEWGPTKNASFVFGWWTKE